MSGTSPQLLPIYSEMGLSGITFPMVEVPGGSFIMGDDKGQGYILSPKPAHEVELDSFYMGQYAVTQRVWEAVMGKNPSYFKGTHLPVEQVSWEDVELFLDKLNGLSKLEGDSKYRLPTEAEWEYAARGGPYSLGSAYAGGEVLEEVAWYGRNSASQTHEVGSKAPNELGIYDMNGNVWEWCQDWYLRNYYQECYDRRVVKNPQGPKTGGGRVCRGGSWGNGSGYCRVASRDGDILSARYRNIGFRLSRTAL